MPDKSDVRKLATNGHPVGRRYARVDAAAAYIDVNPFTIRKMIADGKIHAYRGGGLGAGRAAEPRRRSGLFW
jgi:excisionase family DNA binding protein